VSCKAVCLLVALAVFASCDIIKGGEPAKPPEFSFAEVLAWNTGKVQATFGTPGIIVRSRGSDHLYYEGGGEPPTEIIDSEEFGRRFPVSDPRLTSFDLIALSNRGRVVSLYVRRRYDDPAQRIGFLSKRITALRRQDIGDHLGVPHTKGWCGVNRSEERYDWEFSRSKGPLPYIFPGRYIVQVTFDGDSALVSSVLACVAE